MADKGDESSDIYSEFPADFYDVGDWNLHGLILATDVLILALIPSHPL